MAKRKPVRRVLFRKEDLSAWNFIIFLTLAFILLVLVAKASDGILHDLRSRAGLECPAITQLPRPEDCTGGAWTFKRDANGCRTFFCDAKPSTAVTK